MTLKRAVMVLVLTALAALSGCGDNGSHSDPDVQAPAALVDKTYVVTGVTVKGATKDLVDGTEIRLRFDQGQLTVTAGCNTMSGAYALDGTRLTVEPMSMTEMGCDQARMDQDTWIAGLFDKPVQFTDGGTGAVISGDVVLAIADRESVHPDLQLIGPVWVLDSVAEAGADGAASSFPSGLHVTLTFTADRVAVDDGCNQGAGGFTHSEGRINFGSRTVATPKPCPTDPSGSLEEVEGILEGSVTFVINERSLIIAKGRHTLGFTAKS